MKVSTKIISGIGILLVLSLFVLVNQLFVVRQLELMDRDLADFNVSSALTAVEMTRLADTLTEDSKKYFANRDPLYERLVTRMRDDFAQAIARLEKTLRSDRERRETARLVKALDEYWKVWNRIKHQNQSDFVSLPPDLIISMNHLQAQTDVTYDVVQAAGKEQLENAAEVLRSSVRMSLIAGVLSFVLSVIMAVLIVRAIGEPIRRLTQAIGAITKGQFWHRLPAYGSDEFSELARDFNRMSDSLGGLGHVKKDFE